MVPVSGELSFECIKSRGAALILKEDAAGRDILAKSKFARLIRFNIHKWLTFANDVHDSAVSMEDIILVTGYDRVSAWASAAVSEKSASCKLTFQVGQPAVGQGNISFWGSWKTRSPIFLNSGAAK